MGSLFEISNNLQNIISAIEENGGVITPEIEQELTINEENLTVKLTDYSNLISSLKYDIDNCNSEIKRITELKKSKQKLADRLTTMVIDAVDTFGLENKNKVKYVDLGTKKLSIRRNQSCEVDDEYVDFINEKFKKYVNGLKNTGCLGLDSFTDEFIEEMESGVSLTDLENMKLNIIIKKPITEITENTDAMLNEILSNYDCELVFDVNKTDCKNALNNGIELSYARMNPTKSLITR